MIKALELLGQCEYEYYRIHLLQEYLSILNSSTTTTSRPTSDSLDPISSQDPISRSSTSPSVSSSERTVNSVSSSVSRLSSSIEPEPIPYPSSEPKRTITKSPYFSSYQDKGNLVEDMRTRSQSSKPSSTGLESFKNVDAITDAGNKLITPPTTPVTKSRKRKPTKTHNHDDNDMIADKNGNDRPPTPESIFNQKRRKSVIVEIPSVIEIEIYNNDNTPGSRLRHKSKKRQRNENSNDQEVSKTILDNNDVTETKTTGKGKRRVKKEGQVVTKSENGIIEQIDKIHLIQEKLRFNPWKMLIATSLLNKTAGKAARPILEILLERYPTPQALSEASIPDLAELLYPLGLYNQRASGLIRFSRQYLDLNWPLFEITKSPLFTEDIPPLPPLPSLPNATPLPPPTTCNEDDMDSTPTKKTKKSKKTPKGDLDVTIFHGSGVYASDSFRIFSNLLSGKGAPENERKWLDKVENSKVRMRKKGVDRTGGVEQLADYMSDEEEEVEGEEEEEWRKVIPLDKELRRYLIWRWGIEGIIYDIYTGPKITRERDKKRLSYLLPQEEES